MMKMERLKCELKELLTKRIQTEKQREKIACMGPFYQPILPKRLKNGELKNSDIKGGGLICLRRNKSL